MREDVYDDIGPDRFINESVDLRRAGRGRAAFEDGTADCAFRARKKRDASREPSGELESATG